MTFHLAKIVLYSHQGEIRELKFRSSGLSIITGASKTGKSAIIDIVDYCSGRGECFVAEGVIRKSVSWFAVLLARNNEQIFIARRNPGPGNKTSGDIFVLSGTSLSTPSIENIRPNITRDALLSLLTRFCGISENEHRPIFGTRRPLQATISHAKFLCFQKQYEIANQNLLFHRQGEDFIPQSIKDTLPYFIGAIDERQFLKQYMLDAARDELRKLELQMAQRTSFATSLLPRIRQLIAEGKRAGLIDERFEAVDLPTALARLGEVGKIRPDEGRLIPDFGDAIERLYSEQRNLGNLLSDTKEEIRSVRLFLSDQGGFSREGTEQRGRLSTLSLYRQTTSTGHSCPVCASVLDVPTPNLVDLDTALAAIDRELSSIQMENPHLQKRIDDLEASKLRLEAELVENQAALSKLISEDEQARLQHDLMVARARTIGRIGAFMESYTPDAESSNLEQLIAAARSRVQLLEADLNSDDVSQRMETFLNIIGRQMSDYSRLLDLEHHGSNLRLDIRNLTVVADTSDGPVPLTRMGSGENWVGYHVLTYLALHWWFRQKNRPVPAFTFFDQPSQAHYPPERDQDGRLDPLRDEDRVAVLNLFQLMYAADTGQVIVLDHAHIDEPWFETAIVEEWRHGVALIPHDWIE